MKDDNPLQMLATVSAKDSNASLELVSYAFNNPSWKLCCVSCEKEQHTSWNNT